METISPKFTEQTLDLIVRRHGGVKHTSWRFGEEFPKIYTFSSDIHRLIVTGMNEDGSEFELRLIVKAMPQNMAQRKTFRSVDFFRNEGNFYNVVLKKYADFQKARNVKDGLNEIPRCYETLIDGENDFIVLEDLSADGYETGRRTLDGFEINQCKQLMIALGKFHAISLAIRDQEPDEFYKIMQVVEETYYHEKFRKWYKPYQRNFISVSRDAMEQEYGGTYYELKMKEFTGRDYYDEMCQLANERGRYTVICHGDCWAPNFLFKDDPNTSFSVSAKMVDFQLVRFASPATDLAFFMYTCTQQNLREKYFNELLQVYHRAATSLLSELGSDANELYPYEALEEELISTGKFGVGMAMEALPFCVMDEAATPNVEEMEGDEAVPINRVVRLLPCKTKEQRLRMADTFKHAIDHGLLD